MKLYGIIVLCIHLQQCKSASMLYSELKEITMTKVISTMVAMIIAIVAAFVAPFNKGIKKQKSASGRKYTRLHYTPLLGVAMEKALIFGGHGTIGTPAMFWLSPKGDMTVVIFDGLMQKMTPLAQAFIYLHEEGHVDDTALMQHVGTIKVEVTADCYAIEKLGLVAEDICHVFDELLKFVRETKSLVMEEAISQLLYRKEAALARLQS